MEILLRWISSRHLFHERRTWLTWVGVALGISVFVSIRIANRSVLDAYQRSVEVVAGNTTVEVVGRSGPFDETALVDIRKEAGIDHVAPIVQSALPVVSPSSAEGEILFVVGVDLLQEGPFRQYELSGAGDEKAFNALSDPSAVLLTERFALRHQIKAGETIAVRDGDAVLTMNVAGLLKGRGIAETQDGNIAIADIASAQWRLGKLGKLDRIDLITGPAVPVNDVIARLKNRVGALLAVRRPQQRSEQIEKMLFAFQLNLTALSAISLFVGIFLIYTTLLVSVVHRKKEIGILRSLGVTRRQIFLIFVLEGIGIGMTGGLAGVLIGALLARGVLQLLAQTVTVLYVTIPPSPLSLPAAAFAEGIGIGVVVATLSSFFPALQAGLLKPREAMEGIYTSQRPFNPLAFLTAALISGLLSFVLSQLPSSSQFSWAGYLSAAILLMTFSLLVPPAILFFSRVFRPLLSRLSPPWRIAQGHLEQAMKRNAPTIAAFMGALAMMISVVIMIESFRKTVVLWIDQTIQADLIGAPASLLFKEQGGALDVSEETLPVGFLPQIKETPGIEAVDGYRSVQILFRDEPALLVGRDLAVHAAHSRYLFKSGKSEEVIRTAIREKKVLVSEVFANRFHLREGETIQIPSPQGPVSFEIGGIFYEYSTDGGKLVVDRSLLTEQWQDPRIDVAAIYLKKGVSADSIRQELVQKWGGTGLTFITQSAFKDQILKIFDQTFLITYGLEWIAIVVALLGITNTLLVSILERRREIGILRAVGGSQPQVIQVVLIEAFYMGLIGNILSLFCAFFLSLLLIFVINKASFGWTLLFYFPPSVLLHSFLLATLTALAAGYFPARRAAKMAITEAIAYE